MGCLALNTNARSASSRANPSAVVNGKSERNLDAADRSDDSDNGPRDLGHRPSDNLRATS